MIFIIKVVRNKKFENLDYWKLYFLPLDSNETLYIHRTWEHKTQTEVETFVTVIASMVTVRQNWLKSAFSV